MAVKLHKRQTKSYKLQRCQVKGKDSPYWRTAMLYDESNVIRFFYLADMPRPTDPVKQRCYADDITVWVSGVKIPELDRKKMSCFLRDNSLLISAPTSTVTLLTTDSMHVNTQPNIKISDAELPLVRNLKILGYILIHTSHSMLIAYKWPTESVLETMS